MIEWICQEYNGLTPRDIAVRRVQHHAVQVGYKDTPYTLSRVGVYTAPDGSKHSWHSDVVGVKRAVKADNTG